MTPLGQLNCRKLPYGPSPSAKTCAIVLRWGWCLLLFTVMDRTNRGWIIETESGQSMTRHRVVFFKSLFHLLFQLLIIMWSDYVLSLDIFQCCRPHSHISGAVIFSSEPFNKLFEVPPDMQLRHILSWIAACLEKFIGSGLINSSCSPIGWSYCY